MNDSKKHYSELIGEAVANRKFYLFLNNPKMKGCEFDFATYPIEDDAYCQMLILTPVSDITQRKRERLTMKSARREWNLLCTKHGINVVVNELQ